MLRFVALASLLVLTSPAAAQPTGHYVATAVTAPSKATAVTRDVIWRCTDAVCAAGRSDSRPAVVCELAARALGKLDAFVADGAPFDAAALAKCNARAR